MDDIVSRNCSAVPRGTSGFDICASCILVFSSGVGCNCSNFYKNGKKQLNKTNLASELLFHASHACFKAPSAPPCKCQITWFETSSVFYIHLQIYMPFAKQESLLGTNVVGHMEERCKMTFEWVWLKLNKRQVYILDKRYLQNVGMIF